MAGRVLRLPGRAPRSREVVFNPFTALFLVVVLLVLAYELLLVLTVPPNNADSLAYHLAKAAAWAQHGGYYWIPNAPTVRMNAFQPLAEQQIFFLFVATGRGALYALPQFLAELAILVAVYGTARRLGFEVRAAACSAFLLATFSLVALESTTAQNDLVAASFPAVAACLLLGTGRLEPALAGAAAAFGLGAKLTTALALPVLIWLAFTRGRRHLATAVAGGVLGFVALGMWGYVLNAANTGELLGSETEEGDVLNRAPPSYPGSVANAFYLMYSTMDLGVLSNRLIYALALTGLLAAVGAAAWALRRSDTRRATGDAAGVATPFLAPLLLVGAASALAFVSRQWGFPIRGPGGIAETGYFRPSTRIANANYSAFGPVGIVALLAATALTIWNYVRRRADMRHLALASALPSFLILMSLQTTWNPFLVRFLLVPTVLAAPLLAGLFRSGATTAAYLAVAAITVGLTITHDQAKPLENAYGRPWQLSQVQALEVNRNPYQVPIAEALAAFDKLVPPHACVGAVLDAWEPSYLFFGRKLQHHVTYLSVDDALAAAFRDALGYVVITTGTNRGAADTFEQAGWRVQPLGGLWLLASAPHAGTGTC